MRGVAHNEEGGGGVGSAQGRGAFTIDYLGLAVTVAVATAHQAHGRGAPRKKRAKNAGDTGGLHSSGLSHEKTRLRLSERLLRGQARMPGAFV